MSAAASPEDRETARRALATLDLTDLSDTSSVAAVERLAARATTPFGSVAALCIWPRFVATAKAALGAASVKIATVANFPSGAEPLADVRRSVDGSLAAGADEIDLVMPFRAFLAGDRWRPADEIRAVKKLLPADSRLKVILETGELGTVGTIAEASRLAIGAGADMLKTSTGKAAVGATPEAAAAMLTVIRDSGAAVGFKAAGGIRTPAAAAAYLRLADRILGEGWATPARFRLGASSLLDDLLAILRS